METIDIFKIYQKTKSDFVIIDNVMGFFVIFFLVFSGCLIKLLRKSKNVLIKVPNRYDLLPQSGTELNNRSIWALQKCVH